MDSCADTPKGWVAPFGYPRINACSRLPVAFRSVPRPSSPPGAKASTECPSHARDTGASNRMHRHAQKPASETVVSCQASVVRDNRHRHRKPIPSRGSRPLLSIHTHITHAPDRSPPDRWASRTTKRRCKRNIPGQTCSPSDAQAIRPKPPRSATPDQDTRSQYLTTRPETHQNLIHTAKDHNTARRPRISRHAPKTTPTTHPRRRRPTSTTRTDAPNPHTSLRYSPQLPVLSYQKGVTRRASPEGRNRT
jgi:hypothetical protein